MKGDRLVGSFTAFELQQQIWTLPLLGGSPRRASEVLGSDGAWLANGDVLIAHNNELVEVSPGSPRYQLALGDLRKVPEAKQDFHPVDGRPTKGGVSLTRDDGINLGFDYDLTRSLDLSAGYSRSVYSTLNTFSFGIEVNVASLLKSHSGQ